MKRDLQDLLREATRLTQAGQLMDATAMIQRALHGSSGDPTPPAQATEDAAWVLDGCVFEVDDRAGEAMPGQASQGTTETKTTATATSAMGTAAAPSAAATTAGTDAESAVPTPAPDTFSSGQHRHAQLTRRYKLYVPPAAPNVGTSTLRPLVVMLHGCTQNADDFAAGTAMNELAREQGFFVLYPEQSADANTSRCWNWFKHNHQQRGRGEPALIASLTRAVMQNHAIDPRRVYVAGLSAGGAMAAILGGAYPELFAAVGVHSGLPSGAARNLPEALAAMNSGTAAAHPLPPLPAVPTIVFHGDQDGTVHPKNGERLVGAQTAARAGAATPVRSETGASKRGRRYTRHIHEGKNGSPVAEHWVVHGAGHAWSGGRVGGSYTDASGPDASAEMLRFFLAQPGPGEG